MHDDRGTKGQVPVSWRIERREKSIVKLGNSRYIISSGSGNVHHHPSYWVIRDIKRAGYSVSVVCEEHATEKCFHYHV